MTRKPSSCQILRRRCGAGSPLIWQISKKEKPAGPTTTVWTLFFSLRVVLGSSQAADRQTGRETVLIPEKANHCWPAEHSTVRMGERPVVWGCSD